MDYSNIIDEVNDTGKIHEDDEDMHIETQTEDDEDKDDDRLEQVAHDVPHELDENSIGG